ncbi:penicillin-binding protein 2 [Porphyromonas macacae]|uniref:penicillin-binding protein 2 n=1 Tax=Porphyromonas macacae TaxID=28115 RepID=UPI0035A1721D
MVNDRYFKRRHLFTLLTLAVLFIFTARLFNLQILNNNYKERAKRNAYYYKPIYPARGVIFDRNGELLVYNKPTYDLMVTTGQTGTFDSLTLCDILNITPDLLSKRFAEVKDRLKNPGYSPHTPQVLLSQLDETEAGRFQEQLYKFPGFTIQSRSTRRYKYHHAAHVLGYIAEANVTDIKKDSLLSPGDYTGKIGVEKSYEKELRGRKGYEVLLRDSRGRIKGQFNNGRNDLPAINGNNLTLSIDANLQTLAENLMNGKRGAIVAIEPATGEILAMVSAPGYDPELLSDRNKGENHQMLEDAPGNPLFARAIMGTYPPGSTFKAAQAGVFLEEGVIRPSTLFSCYHGYPVLRNRPACHTHGSPLDLPSALATSCNAYFCWGLRALLDNRSIYPTVQEAFEHWKNRMVSIGFGYPLKVDLYGEKRGYIPNSKVYDKIHKQRWTSSSIISIAIGQGEILATPLQIANLATVIANRGWFYRPHVVRAIENSTLDTAYTSKKYTTIDPSHWETVVEGMARAVTGGTCHGANFAPGVIEVCGKTGTAENPHGKDHSAFMGFAPRDNPQIAVAVYVENGGFGAYFGVPIGRVIMEYYLNKGNLSPATEAIARRMQETSIIYGLWQTKRTFL